jgi:hypothetical protein
MWNDHEAFFKETTTVNQLSGLEKDKEIHNRCAKDWETKYKEKQREIVLGTAPIYECYKADGQLSNAIVERC